ncbi:MAG: hypothetical protein HQL65_20420, partial [Magnetococcales bacterium]|nr:hypothetical protein [Magnetococcales bacterium]
MNGMPPATPTIPSATHTVWLQPHPSRRSLAGAWLLLGLGAFLMSGVFACVLVLSRTPILAAWLPVADWFRISLVLHVDLAVVVWLLSFAGSMWTLAGHDRDQGKGWFGWLAFGLALPGPLLMGVSPLLGARQPIMSNYLPILQHPLFFGGLLLFGCGIFLTALRLVLAPLVNPTAPTATPFSRENLWRWGARCGAWAILLAIWTFLGAWRSLPTSLPDAVYYEHLFWGGGHLLQLAHTLLVMVVWLWLGRLGGLAFPWSPGWVALWFGLGLLPAGAGPVSYLVWPTISVESRDFFTFLMSHGSWPAATLLGIGILWHWPKKRIKDQKGERKMPQKKRIKNWDGGPGGRAAPFPLAG